MLLQQGFRGDDVKKLQKQLNKIGNKLVVDGDFGNDTKNAVIDFQRKSRLCVDGIVGDKTWNYLFLKN